MKSEKIALGIALTVLFIVPTALLGYQAIRSNPPGIRVIDLVAYIPTAGGWQPDTIRVNLGERVRLRLSAADVIHGFILPDFGIEVPEVVPGHITEVEFVADRVGRFPFACRMWCSSEHWRMRGTIEIVDPAGPQALPVTPGEMPLYQQLGVNPDAPRTPVAAPPRRPAAQRGAVAGDRLPLQLQDATWIRTHSPQEAFVLLRVNPAFQDLDDLAMWDVVAYAWRNTSAPGALQRGAQLYARDCAACHGETGRGDGPAGRNLSGLAPTSPSQRRKPADFTDAAQRLAVSDLVLQARVLRGAMGTGMPEWGSLYSDEDIWAVVDYVRSFVFDYGTGPDATCPQTPASSGDK